MRWVFVGGADVSSVTSRQEANVIGDLMNRRTPEEKSQPA
jgi:hypothetical protein